MKARTFVNAAVTISHQPTFDSPGFSRTLEVLADDSELLHPPYKDYIDPVLLRRMSKILRMSVVCSVSALKQAGVEQPSGIIVGTGLGCLQDTEKFLNSFLTLEGLLPPTAFILSTHNTIAGQISLTLGCHAYNITHTQNALSFEMALLDGVMKLEEGDNHLLVGTADEYIPFLTTVAEEWGYGGLVLSSGASFYVLSSEVSEKTLAEVMDVSVYNGEIESKEMFVEEFLKINGLNTNQLGLVLGSSENFVVALAPEVPFVNYLSLSGVYATASAFAFHYAADFLKTVVDSQYVLIMNELNPGSIGLTLLKSVEA